MVHICMLTIFHHERKLLPIQFSRHEARTILYNVFLYFYLTTLSGGGIHNSWWKIPNGFMVPYKFYPGSPGSDKFPETGLTPSN